MEGAKSEKRVEDLSSLKIPQEHPAAKENGHCTSDLQQEISICNEN